MPSAENTIETMRTAWLALAGMMLLSRIIFQWKGPLWMRAFLNKWKVSHARRVWALLALAFGVWMTICSVIARSSLSWLDALLMVLLILVLVGDGVLNALPKGFSTFKDRMQDAWVKYHPNPEDRGDKAMFARVNLLLAALSLMMAGLVYFYREGSWQLLLRSVVAAAILTFALITLTLREQRTGIRATPKIPA